MKILINALSVTNLSGRHVLLGHFKRVAKWSQGEHEFCFLYHKMNRDICRDLGANVTWFECPEYTKKWVLRSFWEHFKLPGILSQKGADALFSPAGTVISGISILQISFAQNPWSLVPNVRKNKRDRIKAFLQRRAYKTAMEKAAIMVFNSEYMHRVYCENSGGEGKKTAIVYQAVSDAMHQQAALLKGNVKREPYSILCVSAMAPHKGVETLVRAMFRVRDTHKIPAKLILVGGWPDKGYEGHIRSLISQLGLESVVSICGHVPQSELHRYYVRAKLFCLMSKCESFGIPSVEAQVFGTPVVSSNCCAIPEVCGKGGVYPEPNDVVGTANQISHLLQDDEAWESLSRGALENASRYHWDICSQGMLNVFEQLDIDR